MQPVLYCELCLDRVNLIFGNVTTRYDHAVTRELSPGDSVNDEVKQVRSAYKQYHKQGS